MTTQSDSDSPTSTAWIPNLQFIGGQWREGQSDNVLTVTDPYNGSTLASIRQANISDLNDAYETAAQAQVGWAARGPADRQRVMLRAAQILENRRDEIIAWLIAESGSTVLKANIELGAAQGITLESASFPHRVQGRILESDIAGKENRVYRRALGVVGVISPWNFPLHLSQRSVAPALALGNAVVIKPASDTPIRAIHLTGPLQVRRLSMVEPLVACPWSAGGPVFPAVRAGSASAGGRRPGRGSALERGRRPVRARGRRPCRGCEIGVG